MSKNNQLSNELLYNYLINVKEQYNLNIVYLCCNSFRNNYAMS